MVKQAGLTIIELMITVVIIAIITAIAVPNYMDSKRRTARVEAQGEMLAVAQRLALYKMNNGSYTGANIAAVYGRTQLQQGENATYNLQLSATTAEPTTTWTLTALPIGNQVKDGAITLTDSNTQCWYKGQATATGTCLSWSEK